MGAPDLPQYRPPSSRPLDAREGRKPFYSHSPSSFATTAATTLTCRSFLNDCAAPFTAQRAAPRREARVSPPREGRKRETEGATLATLLSLAHRVRSTGCARVIYMSRPIQTRTLKVFPLPQRHSFAPAAAATFTRALSSSFRVRARARDVFLYLSPSFSLCALGLAPTYKVLQRRSFFSFCSFYRALAARVAGNYTDAGKTRTIYIAAGWRNPRECSDSSACARARREGGREWMRERERRLRVLRDWRRSQRFMKCSKHNTQRDEVEGYSGGWLYSAVAPRSFIPFQINYKARETAFWSAITFIVSSVLLCV